VNTQENSYTERLIALSGSRLRRFLNVQAPYGWNLRRLVRGEVLDIGCGIGRNLAHVHGQGVGVDHNASSVQVCVERGLRAYTPEKFLQSGDAQKTFGTLLFAHVVEHMTITEAENLIDAYLPFVEDNGQVIIICPQERGYRSDKTHVHFFAQSALVDLVQGRGMRVVKIGSFPLPRLFGRVFTHNETVVVATRRS